MTLLLIRFILQSFSVLQSMTNSPGQNTSHASSKVISRNTGVMSLRHFLPTNILFLLTHSFFPILITKILFGHVLLPLNFTPCPGKSHSDLYPVTTTWYSTHFYQTSYINTVRYNFKLAYRMGDQKWTTQFSVIWQKKSRINVFVKCIFLVFYFSGSRKWDLTFW